MTHHFPSVLNLLVATLLLVAVFPIAPRLLKLCSSLLSPNLNETGSVAENYPPGGVQGPKATVMQGHMAQRFDLLAFPMAKCLDGSTAIYYYRPGHSDGKTKWLLFHEGLGFCSSDAECLARSKTYAGSTRYEAEGNGVLNSKSNSINITARHPFFIPDPILNPQLHNWNHVFLRYCDGGYMSGGREDAVQVRGEHGVTTSIYYRGKYITEAAIEDLKKRQGMANATDVTVSGCSSGAIRTYAHGDALADMIRNGPGNFSSKKLSANLAGHSDRNSNKFSRPGPIRVTLFPDSGFYLDTPRYTDIKSFLVDPTHGMNATSFLNAECLQTEAATTLGSLSGSSDSSEIRGTRGKQICLIGSVVAKYLKTPVFAWQSRYDSDQMGCDMPVNCSTSRSCVRTWGNRLTAEFKSHLLFWDQISGRTHQRGGFLDSCTRHCDDVDALPISETGSTLNPMQSFAKWYWMNNPEALVFDHQMRSSYPCETCCAPRTLREEFESHWSSTSELNGVML